MKSKDAVYEFLKEHAVAVISTVSPDSSPSASPIYFIADQDLNFYFLTLSDTDKSRNIEEGNDIAAITIVDPSVPVTIQASGNVRKIDDPEIFNELTQANAQKRGGFHWPPPLSKLVSGGSLLLYKFQPTWLRVANFSESEENVFHQIIP